jgi:hypothetical protein
MSLNIIENVPVLFDFCRLHCSSKFSTVDQMIRIVLEQQLHGLKLATLRCTLECGFILTTSGVNIRPALN